MENIYLILVVVLFALAISDLVVGVSNDAVNFLNSALGSKAAPFKIIMIIAAAGIFVGATFSSGMMEVARKGIFNPQYFYFSEIMIIFLAVMITDVLLLDLFNTFGMPTSTTVSVVFELLGASVAVSLIKAANNPDIHLSEYINTAKALEIISGILLSVVVAFTVGAIIQYIARLAFSFNYDRRVKYLGAIWGGIAITAITYFILIKGAKGASFMHEDTKEWITLNRTTIIFYSFIAWTLLLQLAQWIFKLNILKLTVLVGTFALAMAFAGNDLVNFIGVPLAGFASFKAFIAAPGAIADEFLMESMAGKVQTDTYLLIIAGIIMIATLWTSKKAKKVVKTSLDLSRQHEGEERFGSSFFGRTIVRVAINASNSVNSFIPAKIRNKIRQQFDSSSYEEKRLALGDEAPVFDMLRASVNLVVASILISMATSYKLPLSTTYVTFMVAMGSSLTDGAWGRESAVYRVTGVLSVIGGWFLTAFSAFSVAFTVALIFSFGSIYAIFAMIALAAYIMYRTHIISHKRNMDIEVNEFEIEELEGETNSRKVLLRCTTNVTDSLKEISNLYAHSLVEFQAENRKNLKEQIKSIKQVNKRIKKFKTDIYKTVKKLQDSEIDTSLYYVQVIDYLRETAHALTFIAKPCFNHLDNNHTPFSVEQFNDLTILINQVRSLIKEASKLISSGNFDHLDHLLDEITQGTVNLKDLRKKQLKRIKKEKSSTQNSMLYLNILHETQNLILHVGNLLKAQRDFVSYNNNK
jgi:phosphate/sulfate permease